MTTLISLPSVDTSWKPSYNDKGELISGTVCADSANITTQWEYPNVTDKCNIDECYCYCSDRGYYFTAFFPALKSEKREKNNQ